MKPLIIIQARMSSRRLPGKTMRLIGNQPLLEYVYNRLACLSSTNKLVVATSTHQSDKPIVNFCQSKDILFYRGSLNNVLKRFYETAQLYKAQIIVRVTADCPLIDPELVTYGIKLLTQYNFDYVSNSLTRTFPRGFDFEVFTCQALNDAYHKARSLYDKEHVTPYVWKTSILKYKIGQIIYETDKSNYRLTVDTAKDFALVEKLICKYKANTKTYAQIIKILDSHPLLPQINQNIKQKTT